LPPREGEAAAIRSILKETVRARRIVDKDFVSDVQDESLGTTIGGCITTNGGVAALTPAVVIAIFPAPNGRIGQP
jgi:hypothetical protein